MIRLKKRHLLLLILTLILAVSSAYSLAAINQVYIIDFDWYSQLYNRFENSVRDVSNDRCVLNVNKLDLGLAVIDDINTLKLYKKAVPINERQISEDTLDGYLYMFCTLGEVSSPEYRIKVVGMAQKSDVIEIKVSINTPNELDEKGGDDTASYKPLDLIRIKKTAFPSKGKHLVIFKNQNGKELAKEFCFVR